MTPESPLLRITDKLSEPELHAFIGWIGPPAPARLKELERLHFIRDRIKAGDSRRQIVKRLMARFGISESTAYATMQKFHFSGADWKNLGQAVTNLEIRPRAKDRD